MVAAAKRDGRTFSNYVVWTLEAALSGSLKSGAVESPEPLAVPPRASAKKVAIALEARDAVQQRNAEMPSLKRGSAVAMDYRCPEASCPRRFGSQAAVCRDHGRKAVKA